MPSNTTSTPATSPTHHRHDRPALNERTDRWIEAKRGYQALGMLWLVIAALRIVTLVA
jgi:hypothetical protein